MAAHARATWGDAPTIIVVEPEAAPALIESIKAGQVVTSEGPVSSMGRLDCKTPSLVALASLAHDADYFVLVREAEARLAATELTTLGLPTTPSGAAGIAALLAERVPVRSNARVLTILSEGPEDA